MESNRIVTKILLPPDTVLDFAGTGLAGKDAKLSVNAGAGLGFNDWGRLILHLLDGGALGFYKDALCINNCETSSRLAGAGLKVESCKLAVDTSKIVGHGLKTEKTEIEVNVNELAGNGLKEEEGKVAIDPAFFVSAVQSQINNNNVVDIDFTIELPYLIDTEFRYKPNGYGYNSGLEIVKTMSSIIVTKSAGGFVLGLSQGPITQTTQDFDFSTVGVTQNVAERQETPTTPNFYAN